MTKQKMQKFTINSFREMFPDEDTCLEWLYNRNYSEVQKCPNCGKESKFYKISDRKVYSCEFCGYQISPTAGTIFHKSSTPLTTWFYVIYLMAQTRGGISAKQIERETGVTYKTAWRMCKQVRSVLFENGDPFSGEVEIDESYFGGRKAGKRGRGAEGKTPVVGMIERNGKLEVRKVINTKRNTIIPMVMKNVEQGAQIFTDEYPVYKCLPSFGFNHSTVQHADKVYVIGNCHTNTIEGFWSLAKNGIKGVYHSVSSDYLQYYLDEYAFRYNHRKDTTPMFFSFLFRASLQSL